MNKEKVLLSAHRALLFNILSSTRFIFINIYEDYINMTIISDKILNDFEKDIYNAVLGELLGDFTKINDNDSDMFFKFSKDSFEFIDTENYGELIFARYE